MPIMSDEIRGMPKLRWVFLLLAWFLAAPAARAFDAIYAFGDSLTDTGNRPAPAPTYFQGRFSNGALWIETLSVQLGFDYVASNNFAESDGETADALAQVQRFVAPTNTPGGLFVVWSGGNDFIHNFAKGPDDGFWNGLIAQSVANLSNAVTVLHADGARVILVPSLVDLSRIPLVLDSDFPVLLKTYLHDRVDQFNAALSVALTAITQANPDLRLITPDFHARFNELLANLSANGFTKADPGALDDSQLTDKSFTGPGQDYVFWDQIHPTTKAHALVAHWFQQTLPLPVPPSRLALVASAGELQFAFDALQTGQSYTLQSRADLHNWNDITSFTATNSVQQWSMPLGSSSQEFFRLKM